MHIRELYPDMPASTITDTTPRRATALVVTSGVDLGGTPGLITVDLGGPYSYDVLREFAAAIEALPGIAEVRLHTRADGFWVRLRPFRPTLAEYYRALERVEQACYAEPIYRALERAYPGPVTLRVERGALPRRLRLWTWWQGVKADWARGGRAPEDFKIDVDWMSH